MGSCKVSHLVVDQQLDGVVLPLDEHKLVGLTRCRVGKRRSQSGPPHARLQPETQRQREDLLHQSLLHPAVHVVGPHREADLEGVEVLGLFPVGSCLKIMNMNLNLVIFS